MKTSLALLFWQGITSAAALSWAPSAGAAMVVAEYFVGSDPGAGLGQELVLGEGSDYAAALASLAQPLAGMAAGTYDVGIRVKDGQGRWSNPLLRRFTIKPGDYTLAGGIDKAGTADQGMTTPGSSSAGPLAAGVLAEYFIGADPGAGRGLALGVGETGSFSAALASLVQPLAGLAAGTYDVGIRVKDGQGRWSNPLLRRFTIKPGDYTLAGGINKAGTADQGMSTPGTSSAGPLAAGVSAEYFIGADPGAGRGLALGVGETGSFSAALASLAQPLAGLAAGTYDVGIRVKDGQGRWSNPLLRRFTIKPGDYTLAGGIDKAGRADQGMTTPGTSSAGPLAAGGSAEYFIGADPGAGRGLALGVGETGSFSAALTSLAQPLAGLAAGTYDVGIRVKDGQGRWSNPLLRRFTIKPGDYTLAGGIDKAGTADQGMSTPGTSSAGPLAVGVLAEYFIGADPGAGRGLALGVGETGSFSAALASLAQPLAGLAAGTYDVGIRVKDGQGRWSNPLLRRFTVQPSSLVAATEQAVQVPGAAVDPAVADVWTIQLNEVVASPYVLTVGQRTFSFEALPGESLAALRQRLLLLLASDPYVGLRYRAELAASGELVLTGKAAGTSSDQRVSSPEGGPLVVVLGQKGRLGVANRAVVAAEYFVDLDPGMGLGTPIPLTASGSYGQFELQHVGIAALKAGGHRLGLRFRNAAGQWGQPVYRGLESFGLFGGPDTTAPTLVLRGDSALEWPAGKPFVDPGVVASDAEDGDLAARVVSTALDVNLIGRQTIDYTVVDLAGNRATASRQVTLVNPTIPAQPSVDALVTNQLKPVLSGLAMLRAGESLTVAVHGAIYQPIPSAEGRWTLPTASAAVVSGSLGAFVNGQSYVVTARSMDAAGNTSQDNAAVRIDTTPPSQPTVDALVTNQVKPMLTGQASLSAGESLSVAVNGASFAPTFAAGGRWTLDTATAAAVSGTLGTFVDGQSYLVTATSRDAAGNTSEGSAAVVIDTTAPAQPMVDALVTNQLKPVLSGQAILGAGESLRVAVNGATYAPTPALDGRWTVNTASSAVVSGSLGVFVNGQSYPATATSRDVAGNTSQGSALVLIDTTAPAAPVVDALVTNQLKPVLSGLAILGAGESLSVAVNGASYAPIPAAGGRWTLDTASAAAVSGSLGVFANGQSYAVTATSRDAAGNTSQGSAAVLIDTTAPAVPTVDELVTNQLKPVLTGQATLGAGESLRVSIHGATYQATPVAGGRWTVNTASAIAVSGSLGIFLDGQSYVVTAMSRDAAGNTSEGSASVLIDTTAPAAPTVDALVTNQLKPVLSGLAVLGAGEILSVAINGATYQPSLAAGGRWTVATATAVAVSGSLGIFVNGQSYPVTATSRDAAGNTSQGSAAVLIDTTAPAAPTVDALVTNQLKPVVTGQAVLGAGESLSVAVNGASYAPIPAAGGRWTLDTASAAVVSGGLGVFANGQSYAVTATSRDAAGNTSQGSAAVLIDTTAPAVPTVDELVTNQLKPVLTGLATLGVGESLRVSIHGATYQATPAAGGRWTVNTASAIAVSGSLGIFLDGQSYVVTATSRDTAGNTSQGSASVLIDATAPVQPTVDALVTNQLKPVLTGQAVLGSGEILTVAVHGAIYQATPAAGGRWTVDTARAAVFSGSLGTFVDGQSYVVTATSRDAAGNTSQGSAALRIDATPPAQPAVDALVTNQLKPVLRGLAILGAGETLTVAVHGALYQPTPAAGGRWTVDTASAVLVSGSLGTFVNGQSYPVTATSRDAAGNTSQGSAAVLIDTEAPTPPTVDALLTNQVKPILSGQATLGAGESLTIAINGASYQALPAAGGRWTVNTATAVVFSGSLGTFVDGQSYPATATSRDAAGNTAQGSAAVLIDTTAPVQPIVDALVTNQFKPVLTGQAILGAGETFRVAVHGAIYQPTPAADGRWTVDTASAATASGNLGIFVDGQSYPVTATSRDAAGNTSEGSAAVLIDATAPAAPAVDELVTNQLKPVLTGQATLGAGESLSVAIHGATYQSTPAPGGRWTVDTATAAVTSGSLGTFLNGQRYMVTAISRDAAGNTSQGSAAVLIDTTAPVTPTVDALVTNQLKPVLRGLAILGEGETFRVAVNGATYQPILALGGLWIVDTATAAVTSGSLGIFIDGQSYTVTATSRDIAGNTSQGSAAVLIDTTAPASPTVDALVTNQLKPVLSGQAILGAGETFIVAVHGATYQPIPALGGLWTVDTATDAVISGSLGIFADGQSYLVTATSRDAAGNTAQGSATLLIDTTAPASPVVDELVANQLKPVLSGRAILGAGETFRVAVNGATYQAIPALGGLWSVDTATAAVTSGSLGIFVNGQSYTVTATSRDAAGNTSQGSAAVLIDTTAPAAPAVDALVTNQLKPVLSGQVTLGSGETFTVAVNGATYQPSPALGGLWTLDTATAAVVSGRLDTFADGQSYTATATSRDAAGNTSQGSATVLIDTTPPAPPAVDELVTNQLKPVLRGLALLGAGESLSVAIHGATYQAISSLGVLWTVDTAVATAVSGSLGIFVDGQSYTVTATSRDAAGNTSQGSATLLIDTTAPASPTVDALVTNQLKPVLTGQATLGEGESLSVAIHGATYQATPALGGLWIVDTATAAAASGNLGIFLGGESYPVTATTRDAAGNTSQGSAVVLIDTAAPAEPGVDELVTNQLKPVLTGYATLDAGEILAVVVNGATYQPIPASGGRWTVDTASAATVSGNLGIFVDGQSYTVTATSRDAAGNTAQGSAAVLIDTTAPAAPAVDEIVTNQLKPVLTGQATLGAGESVRVAVNGATYQVIPALGGLWRVDTATAAVTSGSLGIFSDGQSYPVTATSRDAAGNTAQGSATLLIDTVAPAAPAVDELVTNQLKPVLRGQAILGAGESLRVAIHGATYQPTPAAGGLWTVDTASAAAVSGSLGIFVNGQSYPVTATSRDAAGNTAQSSASVLIDTAAPIQPTVDALVTNQLKPVLTGRAILGAGETFRVFVNGATYQPIPGFGGLWSVNTATDAVISGSLDTFADGQSYPVTATSRDAAGNSSQGTARVQIDTTVPASPVVDELVTNQLKPVLTGRATLGAGETLAVAVNGASYQAIPVLGGLWTVDTATAAVTSGSLAAFADGQNYPVTATSRDAAGNTAQGSAAVLIDTTAPAAPAVDALVTNQLKPVLSGQATLGSGETFSVAVNGATYQPILALGGLWTVNTATAAVTSGSLGIFADGQSYPVTATSRDVAGNTAQSSAALLIDTTAPASPVVNELVTNQLKPVLTGRATLGAGETLAVAVNGATYQAIPAAGGLWTVNTATAAVTSGSLATFVNGQSYPVTATSRDAAGNKSQGSSDVLIDTTAPAAPIVDELVTNQLKPVLTGRANLSAGDTLAVAVNGATYLPIPAAGGLWTVNTATATVTSGSLGAFANGQSYPVTATSRDAAGNTSQATAAVLIDTTPPVLPTVDALVTNQLKPILTGRATLGAGETLALAINGATYQPIPAAGGLWTVNTATAAVTSGSLGAFANGQSYPATATSRDAAGNTSQATAAVLIDTTPPVLPTVDALVTNQLKPILTGRATLGAGETLAVAINGATYQPTPAAGGLWTVNTATAIVTSGSLATFANGQSYPATATSRDTAGNTSQGSADVLIDTTAPAAPIVDALVTNQLKPVLTGRATLSAGETLAVAVNGATYQVIPAAGGLWTVNTATAAVTSGSLATFANGQSYTATATSRDAAGNTSQGSAAVLIDTTPPASPTVDALVTNQLKPILTGRATLGAGETFRVTVNGATYQPTPAAGGLWTVNTATATVTSGSLATFVNGQSYPATATSRDAAGNTSQGTAAILIDTIAPAQPTVDALVTNQQKPLLRGQAVLASGETLRVALNGATYAPTFGEGHSWTVNTATAAAVSGSLGPLADGQSYTISATALDAAGNTAQGSAALLIDATAPAAPTLSLELGSDSGLVGDGLTNISQPVVKGQAEALARVSVWMNAAELGSTVADAAGNWAFRPSAPLSEGLHRLAARAGDAAGNLSPLSESLSISVDTQPPSIPVIRSPQEVRSQTPQLFGTSAPLSVVAVFLNGQLQGAVEAGATGAWSFPFTHPLPDALYAIQVSAQDAAGNVSLKGEVFSWLVDTSLRDDDGNGLADDWESTHFPGQAALPQEDSDGDGTSNLMEFLSGTDPHETGSRFAPEGTKQGPDYTMAIPTQRGRLYHIWISTNLAQWLIQEVIVGDGTTKPFVFQEAQAPAGLSGAQQSGTPYYFKIEISLKPE